MKMSELLKEIENKTTRTSQWDDPNYLADLLLELGSYYATLGPHVAEADQAANLAKSHYEVERERMKLAYVAQGEKVSVAESKAKVECYLKEQDYISLRYKSRLFSITRDGLGTTIDVVRSKLSYLKTEQANQL